jgi:hypothetical protein
MALDNAAFDRKFLSCQFQRFVSVFSADACHFEHNASGLNDRYPEFRVTFTGTHPDFSWFLRASFVWENADPELTAPFYGSGHRFSGCFDLSGGNPSWLQHLQSIFTHLH